MSLDNWIETYSNHTAWETIESTIEQVGELNGDDEDEQQTLEYIRLTLRAVLELQSAPTLLVSPLMLSNLDISVRSNVKAQLDQWAANSNVAHLNNAYTNLHIVLDVVRGWPSSKEQNLRAAAATLRESVKSSHTHLQSLQQAVEETKTILENERDSIHQQLDQREDVSIGRFQELEQSLIQAAQRQDQIEARLDSIVATHQDTFTKAGAGRLAEHQQALKDRRAEFAESLDRAVQESQETLESQQASGENVLARLGELEDQAKKVVEAVALAGTSTDYGKYAKEQKETADQLRRGAIALFVVAAIITGVWVIWIGAEEIELGAILLRLGLSLSFFGAATYAITE